jgi:Domain of unknown function (DUF4440)
MTRSDRLLLVLFTAAVCAGCQPASASPGAPAASGKPTTPAAPGSPESDVRARERAWLDAYEKRDPDVMSNVLADGFVITFPNGAQMDKAAVVGQMRRPRPADYRPPRFTTRGTIALARDGVIILIGQVIETRLDPKGVRSEEVSSYTDTWVREGSTWRVLASHLSRAPAAKP